ncbi:twin-arginine translocase TatA/TatE family subunit [uncultured Maritimibacter sp.]|uniref:twin-arginine translocase TatA/TatE family subunit n=1 Tax=uncultured Maritimibacter sp. TaxID=991866 RepID=UPI0026110157|nr:twin-arginine translocase TatA/TatE family subunit [uncultured Maritimibacter sp.]
MSELLLIGIVALIVVGPKDLPGMFRTLGRFTAKARALGREFSRAMNDAADESGLKGAADGLKGASNSLKAVSNPKKFGLDALNDAADKFEKWDPAKPSGKAASDDPKIAGGKTGAKPVDPERAADTAKIREATERMGRAKLERDKAAAAGEGADATPAKTPTKAPAKTPAEAVAKAPAKRTTKAAGATGTAKPAGASGTAKAAPAKAPAKTSAKTSAKAPAKTKAKPASKAAPKATTKPAAKAAAKPAAKSTAGKAAPKKKAPAKKAASE